MGLGNAFGNLFGSGIAGGDPSPVFPSGSNGIVDPTNPAQLNAGYGRTQGALDQQNAFLQALAAQNGIGNQGNVFGQQQGLASQLQAMTQGGGPNPALAQLANTTGANVANQASLMAGQRGVGANPGLMARQIATQGANTQQQAVGQAAALNAQQQLAAIQALQNQQVNMGNLAGQQTAQQIGASNAYGQNAIAQHSALMQALGGQNNANVAMQSNINSANANVMSAIAKSQLGALNGLGNAAAGAAGKLFSGQNAPPTTTQTPGSTGGPSGGNDTPGPGGLWQDGGGGSGVGGAPAPGDYTGGSNNNPDSGSGSNSFNTFAQGGMVSAPQSPLGRYLSNFKAGGTVPGKAMVSGDSQKNDTVPAMLSPGEVVVPRSATKDPDKLTSFLNAILGSGLSAKGKKK